MRDENLQEHISEITEMSEYAAILNLGASVGWGTLTGTLSLVTILLVASGFDIDAGEIVAGLFFVAAFVCVFTTAAMVLIGLPITFLLRITGQERATIYATCGAVAGFVILAVLFDLPGTEPEMLWLPAAGGLAGAASAYRWGRWRESRAAYRCECRSRRTNPIHDLTH